MYDIIGIRAINIRYEFMKVWNEEYEFIILWIHKKLWNLALISLLSEFIYEFRGTKMPDGRRVPSHDMSKVYSKTRLNSDGHGSLVSEISGPKATTLPA